MTNKIELLNTIRKLLTQNNISLNMDIINNTDISVDLGVYNTCIVINKVRIYFQKAIFKDSFITFHLYNYTISNIFYIDINEIEKGL